VLGLVFLVGFTAVGIVGRMSNDDVKGAGIKPSERPVITPEVYSGEQPWEDWIDQFESLAAINAGADPEFGKGGGVHFVEKVEDQKKGQAVMPR